MYFLTEGVGLEKVQDPFGNTLTYSKNGIVHSAGLSVAFQRDGQGRITRITDPQGQSLQYSYTPQGGLAAYTDPRGVTTASQDYDGQGRLTAVTDRLGHSYDDSGNAVWHGSPMCVGKQTVLSGTKIIATQMRNNLVISIGSPSVESF
ncbi:hypothetical protein KFZ76_21700 [Methylovulum psychrotolerans]|uniref:RHS repeat domain-containing protein n=1 Tax=Methylovulum psychrotolerans TaxID=1704499 RepID=UPI001BFF0ECA|nr:hypothetical protein [Methylovulum psychrotolerans]